MRRSHNRVFPAQAEEISYILVNSLNLERTDAFWAYLRGRGVEDVEKGRAFSSVLLRSVLLKVFEADAVVQAQAQAQKYTAVRRRYSMEKGRKS